MSDPRQHDPRQYKETVPIGSGGIGEPPPYSQGPMNPPYPSSQPQQPMAMAGHSSGQGPHGYPPPAGPPAHGGAPGGYPPPQGNYPPAQPAPAPPRGREDELIAGGSKTVFEFTGAAADTATHRGSRGTFIGGSQLDLSGSTSGRESNLRSGATTWIFLGFAVVVSAAIIGMLAMRDDAPAASTPAQEPVAAEVPAAPAKLEETKADAPALPVAEDPKAAPPVEPAKL
ncbi:MAG: hypothetical protein IAG13_04380, partial [Deltaproteobacteria bacterium]|nr:hypothetical protein [Nannocystaceae bacterium]